MLLCFSMQVFTQDKLSIRINQVISTSYPEMEVYVSVTGNYGEPVLSLVKGNFQILIDGKEDGSNLEVAGFQYTDEPVAYAVMLAANGLMAGSPLDQQKKAAVKLIESMREQDRLSYYVFGEEVKSIVEFGKKEDNIVEENVEILGDNPRLYDALVSVARKFENNDFKRRAIIIMSDGRELGSQYNKKQTLTVLQEMNIPVYSIGFKVTHGRNLSTLVDLAEQTGGNYLYAPGERYIPGTMEIASRQVLQSYVLKFKAKSLRSDGELHQLEIKVVDKNLDASSFKNFIATEIPMSVWVWVVLGILILTLFIVLLVIFLIHRKNQRKKMGITKRKCPKCKRRMKDDWDECIFCKYLPSKKKNRKKNKDYE